MTFNRSHKLAREVTLPGHQELTLTISEPLNAAKTHVLPVKVSARALFNRCSLTPAKGINFGPLQYSSSSKPRSFELANLGEFPLHFRLQASEEQQQPQQPQQQQAQQPGAAPRAGSPSSGKKGAAAKKGECSSKCSRKQPQSLNMLALFEDWGQHDASHDSVALQYTQ